MVDLAGTAKFNIGTRSYPYDDEKDKVRKSHVVRIYEDGQVVLLRDGSPAEGSEDSEDKGDDDDRSYIDVRRTDVMFRERGKGFKWLQTYYKFAWPNDGRDHPEDRNTTMRRIENPDDTSQYVEIPLIDDLTVSWGTGYRYLGKKMKFDNSGATDRKTKKKTINGVDIAIIKEWFGLAAERFLSQGSRFKVPIWADPAADPSKYKD